MKITLLLICSIGFLQLCSAQSIKRQSIGTLGSSYHSEDLSVQQSVGQPYQTATHVTGKSENLPGFIQPSLLSSTTIATTFTVEVDVFPNPATEEVSFNSSESLENLNIEVFDQSGRTIYKEKIEHLSSYKLNCTRWQNGLYILVLTDNSGFIHQSKLIKTK